MSNEKLDVEKEAGAGACLTINEGGRASVNLFECFLESKAYETLCKDVQRLHYVVASPCPAGSFESSMEGRGFRSSWSTSFILYYTVGTQGELVAPTELGAVPVVSPRPGPWSQFLIISRRAALNVIRNPQTSIMQLFVMVFFACIVGLIYFRVDQGSSGIQNRAGALFFLVMNLTFSNLSAIELFLVERKLFIHERSNNYYVTASYFFAKLFSDFIPLRIVPTLVFGTIVYWMVGFQPYAVPFLLFQLILVVTTLCAAGLCFAVSTFVRGSGSWMGVVWHGVVWSNKAHLTNTSFRLGIGVQHSQLVGQRGLCADDGVWRVPAEH